MGDIDSLQAKKQLEKQTNKQIGEQIATQTRYKWE